MFADAPTIFKCRSEFWGPFTKKFGSPKISNCNFGQLSDLIATISGQGPAAIRESNTLDTFKRRLKTYLTSLTELLQYHKPTSSAHLSASDFLFHITTFHLVLMLFVPQLPKNMEFLTALPFCSLKRFLHLDVI